MAARNLPARIKKQLIKDVNQRVHQITKDLQRRHKWQLTPQMISAQLRNDIQIVGNLSALNPRMSGTSSLIAIQRQINLIAKRTLDKLQPKQKTANDHNTAAGMINATGDNNMFIREAANQQAANIEAMNIMAQAEEKAENEEHEYLTEQDIQTHENMSDHDLLVTAGATGAGLAALDAEDGMIVNQALERFNETFEQEIETNFKGVKDAAHDLGHTLKNFLSPKPTPGEELTKDLEKAAASEANTAPTPLPTAPAP